MPRVCSAPTQSAWFPRQKPSFCIKQGCKVLPRDIASTKEDGWEEEGEIVSKGTSGSKTSLLQEEEEVGVLILFLYQGTNFDLSCGFSCCFVQTSVWIQLQKFRPAQVTMGAQYVGTALN